MFNDHKEVARIVEAAMSQSYDDGYKDRSNDQEEFRQCICNQVQQQIEYMQSQIDSLMLEYRRCRADKDCRYCPDEMSKEQLDNWAKNQKVVVDTNNTNLYINGELFEDTLKRFFHAS